VAPNGKVLRRKRQISIGGSVGKREALQKAREIMGTINRAQYVVASQIRLGDFLREYDALHVEQLSASTRAKYRNHIKNHIQPAFANLMLCEITTLLVKQWLDAKREALSWATRTDIRNILSSIFTKADEWGRWKDRNPIERVHVGRKESKREHRKL